MSERTNNTSVETDGEITLKELILKIQEFFKEIKKNWLLVILFIIPFVAFFLFKTFNSSPKYAAKLTFMVNEDEGGGIGGAMTILSQFGLGGGGGGGKFNLDKILELSKTRKIVQSALFKKVEIEGQTDYIANHIIDIYNLHKNWEESNLLKDFKFEHDSILNFKTAENSVLKKLHRTLVGSKSQPGIYSTSINESTGIMTLSITSLSESLSIHWLNTVFDDLSLYYINKSTEKQQYTFDVMNQKVDSLRFALNSAESRLASFKDSHRGLYTKTSGLEESRLQRNLQILTVMYAESVKNKEIAEFSLKNKTPFIQDIDKPLSPINALVESKGKAIFLGSFLGLFLGIGFIIIRKLFRDTMKEA